MSAADPMDGIFVEPITANEARLILHARKMKEATEALEDFEAETKEMDRHRRLRTAELREAAARLDNELRALIFGCEP